MINFFKGFLLILSTCCFLHEAEAQTVEYELIYNEMSCNYEAHAHVISGSAVFPSTIPTPSKFSVVVPAAVSDGSLNVVFTSNPPFMSWSDGNIIYAPAVDPAHDYHSFKIAGGSGGNAYPTFAEGDDILLFAFSLPDGECGSGIRLYINGVDPSDADNGMGGIDFSQSLQLFNITNPDFPTETYAQNRSNAELTAEAPVAMPSVSCTATKVNLMANATSVCSEITGYAWSGPNGFASAVENPTFSIDANPDLQVGTYTLVVTNANGCTTTATIDLGYDNCFVEINCGPLCILNNNATMDAIEPGLYNGTTIKSGGLVDPATNVDFIAEECIDLIPDFEVKLGATFLGDIAPCNPQ